MANTSTSLGIISGLLNNPENVTYTQHTDGDDNVTGTAGNFQNEAAGTYSGTLSGTGTIDKDADPSLPQMTLTLESTLNGGQATALLLDGNFFAQGDDPEGAVARKVDGTVGGVVLHDGVFAAEN